MTPDPQFRIAYYPSHNPGNAYCAQFRDCLAAFGHVEGFDFKSPGLWLSSAVGIKRYDLCVVNWLENGLLDREGRIGLAGRLKLRLQRWLLRKAAKRTVWVKHNHFPHDTHADALSEMQGIMTRYAATFDAVWVHSPAAASPLAHYVPHPLYGPVTPRIADERSPYFIAFGRIAPYKNLLALMSHFPSDRRLVIAGPCADPDYLEALRAHCPDNVEIRAGFLSEPDAQTLVGGSQGLIVCHQDDSMIVSGAFFFALAQGVRLFALPSPFLDWAHEQFGPAVVSLAPDLSALRDVLASAPPRQAFTPAQIAQIDNAFSPRAVRDHLAPLMLPKR